MGAVETNQRHQPACEGFPEADNGARCPSQVGSPWTQVGHLSLRCHCQSALRVLFLAANNSFRVSVSRSCHGASSPSIHDRFCGRSGDCGEARTLALPFFVRTPHAKWLKGWQKAKHSRRRLHATIPNETGQTAISTCTKAKELDEHEGFFGFHASRTCGRSKSSPRCPPSNRPQTEDPPRCAPEADVAPGEGPIRCRSIHVLHT
jgi:hypothetical protein